mgnify:CR=1 FL=1
MADLASAIQRPSSPAAPVPSGPVAQCCHASDQADATKGKKKGRKGPRIPQNAVLVSSFLPTWPFSPLQFSRRNRSQKSDHSPSAHSTPAQEPGWTDPHEKKKKKKKKKKREREREREKSQHTFKPAPGTLGNGRQACYRDMRCCDPRFPPCWLVQNSSRANTWDCLAVFPEKPTAPTAGRLLAFCP